MSMSNQDIEALGRAAKERYSAYIDSLCQGGSADEVKAALAVWNQAQKDLLDALHGKPAKVTPQQARERYAEELVHKVRNG